MAHPPPIPTEQQSDKVYGEHSPPDRKPEVKADPGDSRRDVNTREQGAPGNITQNVDAVRPHGDR